MSNAVLTPEGGDLLEQIARARALLAFDYDGTLAPYVDDRHAAEMRAETRTLLRTAAILYPCAVVSGRARTDVAARLEGVPLIAVIGNHGAEAGFGPLDSDLREKVAKWEARLVPALGDIEGVEVENKGFSLALHYRHARSWSEARRLIGRFVSRLEHALVFEGHAVVNVLPEDAPTKANAIRELCARFALNTVVYVGDDRSDEEAFRCEAVSVAIRIGLDPFSSARYAVTEQAEVDRLLRELVLSRARIDGRDISADGLLRALDD
ncbi:MAG TPA: trehalose-phosphatase [Anaeromyxobacter sp.]|nr:trehalose-phosphatase [Anaeromyxobacter sp.]